MYAPRHSQRIPPFDFQGLLLFDRGGKITPALRDPWVRQALNHALDRRTMLSALRL